MVIGGVLDEGFGSIRFRVVLEWIRVGYLASWGRKWMELMGRC